MMPTGFVVDDTIAIVLINGTTLEGALRDIKPWLARGIYLSPADDLKGLIFVPEHAILYIQQAGGER
jgi:hypothetical protein